MSRLRGSRWPVLAAGLLTSGLGACVTMGSRGIAAGSGSAAPAGPAGRAVREVYVGPGVVQYFLLPQKLVGPAGQYAELDVVVRDSVQRPLYGLVHLSVVAPAAIRLPADTLLLSGTARPVALPAARVLFTELKGKAVLTRLEVYLTPAQTLAYLRSPNRSVWLSSANGRQRFEPGPKAAAALATLAEQVAGGTRP